MIILLGLGIVLAGIALVIARHGGSIGEVTAGSLLLFSGAYFPVDILPPVIRDISLLVPVTYWLEGIRRAIHGGILTYTVPGSEPGEVAQPISPILATFDNWHRLAILAGAAAASAIVSVLFYQWVEHQAKERGMIDRLTGY
jgi:ABC-2 type transport system permease protein